MPTPESQPRRARAGTLPSRFSNGPIGGLGGLPGFVSKSSRATPSPSPYKTPSPGLVEIENTSNNAALLSRLRAGSVPQRIGNFPAQPSTPFGPSVFSTNWSSGRERTSTLASIASIGSNGPSSPAQSAFSKEGTGDNDMQMRTLDYLGLADTPQPPRATLAANPFLSSMIESSRQANRFRSYSVNAAAKYEDDEDDFDIADMSDYEAQQVRLQYEIATTNAAIAQHNLAVQAFANQASTNRPRARTAGVLDSPGGRGVLRSFYPRTSGLDNSISASDLRLSESHEYDGLPEAVQALNLGYTNGRSDTNHLTTDEQSLEGPTRALWLGSIPSSTTTSTLTEMFKAHGPIISARVLTHKNCGFVNFERLDSAIAAKLQMNGKEIFPGAGPVRINYAKPPSSTGTPGYDGTFPSPSPDPFSQNQENGSPTASANNGAGISRPGTAPLVIPSLKEMTRDILEIVKEFGATEEDQAKIGKTLFHAISYDRYETEIPAVKEPSQNRIHDAPKLREIRKRIDNNSWSQQEIENTAIEMLPEIAELSSDYLGNTVVQKLFEFCPDSVRDAMLEKIAPHMAEIGVHKNGTWAAQKIIDVARLPLQMALIVEHLRPYTVPLFLDQFGNYVLQCCLRFGAPHNDFIFETMLTKMWEIAQGRYGARAMRACLESHHSTREQQRILAAAIAMHSVQLATNANGALLLTWFLDTCTFPQRRSVLAPRLVPHLVHLCTHKVAYLTVLKVINQRNEPEARDKILKALFFSPDNKVLEDILADHACGATLIFKVLTTPFFDDSIRGPVVENIRTVLQRLKAQPGQGYKRLMDEVGLSTRNGSTGPSRDHGHPSHSVERPRTGPPPQTNGHLPPQQPQQQQVPQQQYQNQYYPQMQSQNFDMGMGMQRTESVDSNPAQYPQYNMQVPAYPNPNLPVSPINMNNLVYNQNMLRAAQPQMNGFFNGIGAINGGFGGYSQSPMVGAASPGGMQVPQAMGMPQNGFGAQYGMNTFGYPPAMGVQSMGYMQQEQVNTRRGRVRSPHSPQPTSLQSLYHKMLILDTSNAKTPIKKI
jgi:protein JSN1